MKSRFSCALRDAFMLLSSCCFVFCSSSFFFSMRMCCDTTCWWSLQPDSPVGILKRCSKENRSRPWMVDVSCRLVWWCTAAEQWAAAAVLCVIAWSNGRKMSTQSDRSAPPLSTWRQQNEDKSWKLLLINLLSLRGQYRQFYGFISSKCCYCFVWLFKVGVNQRPAKSNSTGSLCFFHNGGGIMLLELRCPCCRLTLIKLSVWNVYEEQQIDDLGVHALEVLSVVERMIWWFRPPSRSKGAASRQLGVEATSPQTLICTNKPLVLSALSGSWKPNRALQSLGFPILHAFYQVNFSANYYYYYLTSLLLFLIPLFPIQPPPHRRLAGAVAPSGDQVEGVRDGGGGEGQESHDLHPPAGGGVQHPAGFSPPTEAGRGLQSGGERPHLDPSHIPQFHHFHVQLQYFRGCQTNICTHSHTYILQVFDQKKSAWVPALLRKPCYVCIKIIIVNKKKRRKLELKKMSVNWN